MDPRCKLLIVMVSFFKRQDVGWLMLHGDQTSVRQFSVGSSRIRIRHVYIVSPLATADGCTDSIVFK